MLVYFLVMLNSRLLYLDVLPEGAIVLLYTLSPNSEKVLRSAVALCRAAAVAVNGGVVAEVELVGGGLLDEEVVLHLGEGEGGVVAQLADDGTNSYLTNS